MRIASVVVLGITASLMGCGGGEEPAQGEAPWAGGPGGQGWQAERDDGPGFVFVDVTRSAGIDRLARVTLRLPGRVRSPRAVRRDADAVGEAAPGPAKGSSRRPRNGRGTTALGSAHSPLRSPPAQNLSGPILHFETTGLL